MFPTPPNASSPPPGTTLLTADTAQLTQHLGHCAHACGPLHRVRGAVEMADAFLSSRFVSTLVVLAVVLTVLVSGLGWLVA
jgi:hypothetical protein